MSLHTLLLSAVAAPESHEQQLLDIDGTIFVQLTFFALVAMALTRWLWKPYLKIREERSTRVDGYRAEASKLEAAAAERLTKLEAELGEARRLGSGERAVARAEAHAREQTILAEAQAAAQRTLADARAKVDATLATEHASLQAKAVELGRQASRQILGREVSSL